MSLKKSALPKLYVITTNFEACPKYGALQLFNTTTPSESDSCVSQLGGIVKSHTNFGVL